MRATLPVGFPQCLDSFCKLQPVGSYSCPTPSSAAPNTPRLFGQQCLRHAQKGAECSVLLERLVYAQHGHELMGCKSPVGEPLSLTGNVNHRIPSKWLTPFISGYLTPTPSRGQGQTREGMSKESLSAKRRADEQKRHIRPASLGRAGTRQQSPVVRGIR